MFKSTLLSLLLGVTTFATQPYDKNQACFIPTDNLKEFFLGIISPQAKIIKLR